MCSEVKLLACLLYLVLARGWGTLTACDLPLKGGGGGGSITGLQLLLSCTVVVTLPRYYSISLINSWG